MYFPSITADSKHVNYSEYFIDPLILYHMELQTLRLIKLNRGICHIGHDGFGFETNRMQHMGVNANRFVYGRCGYWWKDRPLGDCLQNQRLSNYEVCRQNQTQVYMFFNPASLPAKSGQGQIKIQQQGSNGQTRNIVGLAGNEAVNVQSRQLRNVHQQPSVVEVDGQRRTILQIKRSSASMMNQEKISSGSKKNSNVNIQPNTLQKNMYIRNYEGWMLPGAETANGNCQNSNKYQDLTQERHIPSSFKTSNNIFMSQNQENLNKNSHNLPIKNDYTSPSNNRFSLVDKIQQISDKLRLQTLRGQDREKIGELKKADTKNNNCQQNLFKRDSSGGNIIKNAPKKSHNPSDNSKSVSNKSQNPSNTSYNPSNTSYNPSNTGKNRPQKDEKDQKQQQDIQKQRIIKRRIQKRKKQNRKLLLGEQDSDEQLKQIELFQQEQQIVNQGCDHATLTNDHLTIGKGQQGRGDEQVCNHKQGSLFSSSVVSNGLMTLQNRQLDTLLKKYKLQVSTQQNTGFFNKSKRDNNNKYQTTPPQVIKTTQNNTLNTNTFTHTQNPNNQTQTISNQSRQSSFMPNVLLISQNISQQSKCRNVTFNQMSLAAFIGRQNVGSQLNQQASRVEVNFGTHMNANSQVDYFFRNQMNNADKVALSRNNLNQLASNFEKGSNNQRNQPQLTRNILGMNYSLIDQNPYNNLFTTQLNSYPPLPLFTQDNLYSDQASFDKVISKENNSYRFKQNSICDLQASSLPYKKYDSVILSLMKQLQRLISPQLMQKQLNKSQDQKQKQNKDKDKKENNCQAFESVDTFKQYISSKLFSEYPPDKTEHKLNWVNNHNNQQNSPRLNSELSLCIFVQVFAQLYSKLTSELIQQGERYVGKSQLIPNHKNKNKSNSSRSSYGLLDQINQIASGDLSIGMHQLYRLIQNQLIECQLSIGHKYGKSDMNSTINAQSGQVRIPSLDQLSSNESFLYNYIQKSFNSLNQMGNDIFYTFDNYELKMQMMIKQLFWRQDINYTNNFSVSQSQHSGPSKQSNTKDNTSAQQNKQIGPQTSHKIICYLDNIQSIIVHLQEKVNMIHYDMEQIQYKPSQQYYSISNPDRILSTYPHFELNHSYFHLVRNSSTTFQYQANSNCVEGLHQEPLRQMSAHNRGQLGQFFTCSYQYEGFVNQLLRQTSQEGQLHGGKIKSQHIDIKSSKQSVVKSVNNLFENMQYGSSSQPNNSEMIDQESQINQSISGVTGILSRIQQDLQLMNQTLLLLSLN